MEQLQKVSTASAFFGLKDVNDRIVALPLDVLLPFSSSRIGETLNSGRSVRKRSNVRGGRRRGGSRKSRKGGRRRSSSDASRWEGAVGFSLIFMIKFKLESDHSIC